MRLRTALVLAVAVAAWVAWGLFIYRPAPNALPPMARFCGPVVCALSGDYSIFVVEFGDGSRHAIGVSCAGVGPCRVVQTYTPGVGG